MQERDPDAKLVAIIHHGGVPIADKVNRGFSACVRDAQLADSIPPTGYATPRRPGSWNVVSSSGSRRTTLA